jgi:hypothetical protein
MEELFNYGYQRGKNGIVWQTTPSEHQSPRRMAGGVAH